VRHQINVICSKKSAHQIAIEEFDELDDLLKNFIQSENDRQKTGLSIMFVRLTKPKLPPSIEKNYLALAEEKTLKKVIEEKKERLKSEKESESMMAAKDNEMKAQSAESENRIMIQRMKAKQEEAQIANAMTIAEAQAASKRVLLEAEALTAMFAIPGYVSVKVAEASSANTKVTHTPTPTHTHTLLCNYTHI